MNLRLPALLLMVTMEALIGANLSMGQVVGTSGGSQGGLGPSGGSSLTMPPPPPMAPSIPLQAPIQSAPAIQAAPSVQLDRVPPAAAPSAPAEASTASRDDSSGVASVARPQAVSEQDKPAAVGGPSPPPPSPEGESHGDDSPPDSGSHSGLKYLLALLALIVLISVISHNVKKARLQRRT
jgi:hypothetical protein